jgi:hypothetical protein
VSPHLAAARLEAAEFELLAAQAEGRSRDVAAWQIAVDVLRHFASHA